MSLESNAFLNVSIFGGFVFGDTPKNGIAVVVTGREDEAPARALALELAERAWTERARYQRRLASIDDAVALALSDAPDRGPVIFSDAGNNPGGGGGGNTTWLLRSLVEAGARGVLYGSFFDPDLARAARIAGAGGSLNAVFNSAGETEFARRLEVPAVVRAVREEPIVGRRGIYAGRTLDLSPMAALEIGGPGGIAVVVVSARHQTADPNGVAGTSRWPHANWRMHTADRYREVRLVCREGMSERADEPVGSFASPQPDEIVTWTRKPVPMKRFRSCGQSRCFHSGDNRSRPTP